MKRFIFGAVMALGLAVVGTAAADAAPARGGHGGHGGGRGASHGRPYHVQHGRSYLRGGVYFQGRHHNHWGHRTWTPTFRRYHYWEPTLRVYYYLDDSCGCYYPVSPCSTC